MDTQLAEEDIYRHNATWYLDWQEDSSKAWGADQVIWEDAADRCWISWKDAECQTHGVRQEQLFSQVEHPWASQACTFPDLWHVRSSPSVIPSQTTREIHRHLPPEVPAARHWQQLKLEDSRRILAAVEKHPPAGPRQPVPGDHWQDWSIWTWEVQLQRSSAGPLGWND